ncbi:MAG: peptidylprolyl isomerase [Clostridia bacterium]|nr:peptidylprolyl isomerase [Clostridia bacterium]
MKRKIVSLLLLIVTVLTLPLALSSCTKKFYYVKMEVRDYGTVIMCLDTENAPITVKNFVKLVKSGFYDGLTFHRVMENFMIQGGDPKGTGGGGSGKTIKGEFAANGHQNNIPHEYGVVSMARGNGYDSASSQFFICNTEERAYIEHLDGLYAAFGWVVEGMEVVDAITEQTSIYAVDGVIEDATKRAVIERMSVINYKK